VTRFIAPPLFLLKLLRTRCGFLSVLLLRLRVIEDMLAGPGIIVSHQRIRLWAKYFGRTFANNKLGSYHAVKREFMPDVALRLHPVPHPTP